MAGRVSSAQKSPNSFARQKLVTMAVLLPNNDLNNPATLVIPINSNRAMLDIRNQPAMMATLNMDQMLEATLTATKDR